MGLPLQTQRKVVLGFVVRDHDGTAIIAGAGNLAAVHDDLACAEAQACIGAFRSQVAGHG